MYTFAANTGYACAKSRRLLKSWRLPCRWQLAVSENSRSTNKIINTANVVARSIFHSNFHFDMRFTSCRPNRTTVKVPAYQNVSSYVGQARLEKPDGRIAHFWLCNCLNRNAFAFIRNSFMNASQNERLRQQTWLSVRSGSTHDA